MSRTGTGPRALGEAAGLLGDVPRPAQLGRHVFGNQARIHAAHHVGSQQLKHIAFPGAYLVLSAATLSLTVAR